MIVDGQTSGRIVPARLFLSIVIPARNEEGNVERTCRAVMAEFGKEGIDDYEIILVNDHSSDGTPEILRRLARSNGRIRAVENHRSPGFGMAVRRALEEFRGEAVCVMMADLSDSPADLLRYYRELKAGAECVFGSRFVKGSKVVDYPKHKLILNRLANWFIKAIFRLKHNDITNAFKAYRREVIEGIQPLFSKHFNLTVEMPLKAIVRGYKFKVVPISWFNRTTGVSKLKIKEMGGRYLFIILYAWLEKTLSRGDYYRGRSQL